MSTYNGEKYIEAQIDSILAQDFQEFRLIVRDDSSTDNSVDTVERFCASDSRVEIARDDLGNLGASRSFSRLLEISDSDFFMLADQDDVWLPGKISSSVRKIEELGTGRDITVPLLVFTDLIVCDEKLNEIGNSLWKYQHLDPEICRNWKRLLAQNVVTGCTMIGNAAARRASLPLVLDRMFHDHWIAVNVGRVGIIDYLPSATVRYRQHSTNAEGAKNFGLPYVMQKLYNPVERYRLYKQAGHHFGVSANRLFVTKMIESLKRFARPG